MFGKSSSDSNSILKPATSSSSEKPVANPEPAPAASKPAASPTSGNFISKEVSINGKIKLSGDITIDGKLVGEITSKGAVTISDNADIKANIFASSIIISGKVDGNLSATERLEIRQTANVKGDIKTGVLKVDPGATFTGRSQVGPTVKVSEPQAAPVKTSAPAAQATTKPAAKEQKSASSQPIKF